MRVSKDKSVDLTPLEKPNTSILVDISEESKSSSRDRETTKYRKENKGESPRAQPIPKKKGDQKSNAGGGKSANRGRSRQLVSPTSTNDDNRSQFSAMSGVSDNKGEKKSKKKHRKETYSEMLMRESREAKLNSQSRYNIPSSLHGVPSFKNQN